jgi:hypothetical protein
MYTIYSLPLYICGEIKTKERDDRILRNGLLTVDGEVSGFIEPWSLGEVERILKGMGMENNSDPLLTT